MSGPDGHVSNSELLTELAKLGERVNIFTEEFKRERDGSQEHRRGLRETIGALSEAIRTLTAKVELIEPLVFDYRENRDLIRGARLAGHYFLAGVVTLAAVIGAGFSKLIDWFVGRH